MARAASERLEMRVRPEIERQLRAAAALERVSVSAFVTAAAVAHAERVLAEAHTWAVTRQAFDELLAGLDAPPVRNDALTAAIVDSDVLVERR